MPKITKRGFMRMLGAVTPTSIQAWLRVSDEFLVAVETSESPRFEKPHTTQPLPYFR